MRKLRNLDTVKGMLIHISSCGYYIHVDDLIMQIIQIIQDCGVHIG